MAPSMLSNDGIYSATYSSVPVFEFNVEGNHVMRRRHDDWINATHILKVADYDKPQRTRILEREVQKGVHEKVQGGYGKYQGTWVPLHDGRILAERNQVLHKLRPLFDYIPGDISPPQAPKHATNKPKIPKPGHLLKKQKTKARPSASQISEDFEDVSAQLNDDESLEGSSVYSAPFIQDHETPYYINQVSGRKRKRAIEAQAVDQQQTLYADNLLDYFMLSASGTASYLEPPMPPPDYEVDRPIDELGHTALHWATAMGDISVIKTFLDINANPASRNVRGETPLIRAVVFTNNHDKGSMGQLVDLLKETLCFRDNFGATVLHHVAKTTNSSSRKKVARHYFAVLLHKLYQLLPTQQLIEFLNAPDHEGDTALHIVAKNNAKKSARLLVGSGASSDIPNASGDTAERHMQRFASQHRDEYALASSSSPVQSAMTLTNGNAPNGPGAAAPSPYFGSEAARSFSESFGNLASGKGLQMAIAIDAEMKDKETDLEEAHRLCANVENERTHVRSKTFTLLNRGELDEGSDDPELDALQREYDEVKDISESYLEQEQHEQLHTAVRKEESELPLSAHHAQMNGATLNEVAIQERLLLAWELAAEQEKRQRLVKTVVEAQANAGMTEKGEQLKSLIATIIDVPDDEVVGLVPELLEELELNKMDAINGRIEPATFAI